MSFTKTLFTSDWEPLGDVYFRKRELYDIKWKSSIDLCYSIVASAPFGGPTAVVHGDAKVQKEKTSSKPIISIYAGDGREIAAFRWESGLLLQIGWSNSEQLLCVQTDGTVLVYDIFSSQNRHKRTFGMGQEAKDTKAIDCKFFNSLSGTGIAVLTGTFRIFVVNNVEDPRIRRLAEVPGLTKPPSSWCMLNIERQTLGLVAKESKLYLLDHGGQYQELSVEMSSGESEGRAFIDMAVSYNHKFLALFTDTGLLWIGSSDLKNVYCEFDTKCPTKPLQLMWCGTGAIIGYWENILLMVGPKKDWIKYSYDSPVHLVQECDGVRIIGNDHHEFLQRVPEVVEEVFKIGSMSPGAMLFQAAREYYSKSQRADEYIRLIKPKLCQAVEQCIEAAGHEDDTDTQKSLLQAASFGKCFLSDYDPTNFVTMCQYLRILYAVRDPKIGIPLTYKQLNHLRMAVLIDRLVVRNEYCLATRICQYLKLAESDGASRILAHWACYKVQQKNVEDEQIARAIAQKLGDTPGISYSEIANKAIYVGREKLAIRLLDFEPKASEQVPLLMKMKRDKLALAKAIESGDTELVYTVLLHLKDQPNMQMSKFCMEIRELPVARDLFLQYCRQHGNRKMLHDLYYQEDNYQEEANCRIIDSYDEDRVEERLKCLENAQDSFTKAKNEWAAKQTEEQVKLLKYQRRLEEELNRSYMDTPLHQTVYKLLIENNHKLAEQLRKEFKLPDRRYWWLKIKALSEIGDWMELEKFFKSKKSPIGAEPFGDVCIEYGNRHEAQKYLMKVLPENRVKYHVKAGFFEQAADIAFAQKSEEDLNYVLLNLPSSLTGLSEKIQTFKNQLNSKR